MNLAIHSQMQTRGFSLQDQAQGAAEWWIRLENLFQEPIPLHSEKQAGLKYSNKESCENNVKALLSSLKACSITRNLNMGKQVHGEAVKYGHGCNIYIGNALINMYAKCHSMADACQLFDSMKYLTVVSWNVLILGYADNGQGSVALNIFTRMRTEGPTPDAVTFVAALKACSSIAVKEGSSRLGECRGRGSKIHNIAVGNGCNSDVYVQSTLVDMYAKCNDMADARDMFNVMKRPTVVSWNVLLLGYVKNGENHTALDMFTRMRTEGPAPDPITSMAAVKACTCIAVNEGIGRWAACRETGKEIHNIAMETGCDVYVRSTLVGLFSKCGSMVDARDVFDGMKHPDVVSWTLLISGYADNGQGYTALDMFSKMRTEGSVPSSMTVVAALKACTSFAVEGGASRWAECRRRGEEIHKFVLNKNCSLDVFVQNALVDMYAKCGSIAEACKVFNCIEKPTVVSWTTLILGHADNGQGYTSLSLFNRMRTEGPAPNSVTLGAAFKACGLVGALEFGRKLHSEINSNLDVVLVTCLVDFYAKCGSLVEAERVFYLHAEERNVRTWTALLAGFSSCGDVESVFGLFEEMQNAGFQPNGVTFLCVLTCCRHAGLIDNGMKCFDVMCTKHGIVPTVDHYNCMIDLLGRANKLDDALDLLKRMPCRPNVVSWMTILSACRKWNNLEMGKVACQSLRDLNNADALHVNVGVLQEQNMLKATEQSCWTNEAGEVHTFLAEDSQHPQIHEIREKWKSLCFTVPDLLSFRLHGHSEILALVCGLINTDSRKPIRIVKNLRICQNGHIVTALISKLENRTIICRDANRIHFFTDGDCSCRNSL